MNFLDLIMKNQFRSGAPHERIAPFSPQPVEIPKPRGGIEPFKGGGGMPEASGGTPKASGGIYKEGEGMPKSEAGMPFSQGIMQQVDEILAKKQPKQQIPWAPSVSTPGVRTPSTTLAVRRMLGLL